MRLGLPTGSNIFYREAALHACTVSPFEGRAREARTLKVATHLSQLADHPQADTSFPLGPLPNVCHTSPSARSADHQQALWLLPVPLTNRRRSHGLRQQQRGARRAPLHACKLVEARLLKRLRFADSNVYSVSVSIDFGSHSIPDPGEPARGTLQISFSSDPDRAKTCAKSAQAELRLLCTEGS